MSIVKPAEGEMPYRRWSEIIPSSLEAVMNPPRGIPLSWWPMFSELLGGLRPHEVTLICASTGSGKTSFISQVSAQLILQGFPHFAAPVETGDIDYSNRVVGALAGMDLNTGENFSPEMVMRVFNRIDTKVKQAEFYIASYDSRVAVEDMISMLTYQHAVHGIKVALLDNLNFFLKVTSSQMEKAEMDNAIHEFIMLVKKIPIHVILIVHPRKTIDGRVESEFDIKGSSTAVQEAANILLFNRPSQKQIESNEGMSLRNREAVFKKIRKRGHNVGKKIWFSYDRGLYEETTFQENKSI